MKIDRVLLSSDDNPMYFDFWEPISRVWNEKFGIIPTLLYFGNGNPSEKYGEVVRFDSKSKHSSHLRTLWSRYWYPSTQPEKVFCIGDIDMIPISKAYFIDSIQDIPEDYYVHLMPNHLPMPSCYHVATGKLFKEVLDLPNTFEESLDLVWDANFGADHPQFGFSRWGSDEQFATMKINQKVSAKLVNLKSIDRPPNSRIDRSNWSYTVEDVRRGKYVDSHSIRPYKENKEEIDRLISLIP